MSLCSTPISSRLNARQSLINHGEATTVFISAVVGNHTIHPINPLLQPHVEVPLEIHQVSIPPALETVG